MCSERLMIHNNEDGNPSALRTLVPAKTNSFVTPQCRTDVCCAGVVADRSNSNAGVLHLHHGLHGVPGLPLQRREVLHKPPPQAAAAASAA
jgi:hypothetical protein